MIAFTMRRLAAAVGLVVPLVAVLPQSRSTGFVVGRVVDADTNRPIAGATVALAPIQASPGDPSPLPVGTSGTNVLADSDGRFLFRGLAPGTYALAAKAPAYLDGGLGQRRAGGRVQQFVLNAGQAIGDMTIRLWKEAVIAGTVADTTGAPVADVWVQALRRDMPPRPGQLPAARTFFWQGARTDDQGHYRIGGLEPGEYVVTVPSRLVQVPVAAATPDPAALESMRASGSPSVSPNTRATRLGDSLLLTAYDGFAGGSNALATVLPIAVGPKGGVTGYPATFYSGATTITAAETLVLKAGDDRTNIDVRLRPVTMVSVSGTVTGPDGPLSNFAVHLIPAFAANSELERIHSTALTVSNRSGAFSFAAVAPGQYVIKAWRRAQGLVTGRESAPPADTTLWVDLPLTVADTAISGLALTLQPGAIVSGRVRFEGAVPPPMPGSLQSPLSVAFEPPWTLAFGNRLGVHVSPAFEFTTLGLPPGKYLVSLPNQFSASLRGWFFESAIGEGRDLTVVPMELNGQRVSDVTITFSDKRSEVTGVVLDKSGRPDSTAAVLIFPADHRSWAGHGLSPLAARADVVSQSGTFAIPIKPGAYLVAAIDEDTLNGWTRPGAIDAIARSATPVTLARGESKRVELRHGSR
jgi:protocatechuate 3,4-dioxygenase beta subunit